MNWDDIPIRLTPQEIARRLVRARNWHLYQAGAQRHRLLEVAGAVNRHEEEAERIGKQIAAMGFDPQPPMGPRAV